MSYLPRYDHLIESAQKNLYACRTCVDQKEIKKSRKKKQA